MEFDDSGLVVAQLVAVIRQQLFLGPHHEGHPEPAIEGAAMIEGVAAVQNPAVTGIDSYRGVPAGVTGHRHQNDTGADGIEGFGRCESGATPSFLGYHGYPASICASINDRVVHGIPSTAEVLAPGDLVSIDCGAVLDGWHGDAAITFGVGALSDADEALSEATRESLQAGIAAMVVGNRLTDVAHAIETGTRAAELRYGRSFGIVAGYGGHGIGRQMHMDPFLPNEGAPGRGPLLAAGSVLAIEPMLTLGTTKTVVLDDKWTVTTADGSRAAHWEHTVAVTDDGPRILTLG